MNIIENSPMDLIEEANEQGFDSHMHQVGQPAEISNVFQINFVNIESENKNDGLNSAGNLQKWACRCNFLNKLK